MEIKGKYATAKVFTKDVDAECQKQIQEVCDLKIFKNSNIRIMPDCHSGKGCVIGFTADIKDKIIPNLVGVDISCSISTCKINKKYIDFVALDNFIKEKIPANTNVRQDIHYFVDGNLKEDIREVVSDMNEREEIANRDMLALGTLGGGNHFIEVDKDEKGYYYITIHTGSRNFGKRICDFHQKKAISLKQDINIPNELAYLEGEDKDLYMKHVQVARDYVRINHQIILLEIMSYLKADVLDYIFVNHNYVESENDKMIIRKGSISAKNTERVLIPINMRDGMIIGKGKGNNDWNCSAPHGAGRIMSRTKAKNEVDLELFKQSMEGIYSSCVSQKTLDESPFAYKNIDSIINNINDNVKIEKIVKPVYNFKGV